MINVIELDVNFKWSHSKESKVNVTVKLRLSHVTDIFLCIWELKKFNPHEFYNIFSGQEILIYFNSFL